MRRIDDLPAFVAAIEAHRQALGLTEADLQRARNTGERRTEAKRAAIASTQRRAKAAGLEPLPAGIN